MSHTRVRAGAVGALAAIMVAATGCAGLDIDLSAVDPVAQADELAAIDSGDSGGAAATAQSSNVAAQQMLAVLDTLPVKGRAPKTGYARSQFGQAWTDDNDVEFSRNGCDTRNDVLNRDLHSITHKKGTRNCVVLTGVLEDPYTGKTIHFTRGKATSSAVQIDHLTPLSLAWQTGAQQLSARERQNFANDPRNLLAVDGPANMSKSDSDAATWLPKNKQFRCQYITLQIQVKKVYRLWVTKPEKAAMQRVLDKC